MFSAGRRVEREISTAGNYLSAMKIGFKIITVKVIIGGTFLPMMLAALIITQLTQNCFSLKAYYLSK